MDAARGSGRSVILRRPEHALIDVEERLRRTSWPRRTRPWGSAPSVSVVTVNYNTRTLIARLLFTLTRVLPAEALARIVVVDNGSTDGSRELLDALDAAGVVD